MEISGTPFLSVDSGVGVYVVMDVACGDVRLRLSCLVNQYLHDTEDRPECEGRKILLAELASLTELVKQTLDAA
jgi:hypothetical protein